MLADRLVISGVSAADALGHFGVEKDTHLTFVDVVGEKDGTVRYTYKTNGGDGISIEKKKDGTEAFVFESGLFRKQAKQAFAQNCYRLAKQLKVPADLLFACGGDEALAKRAVAVKKRLTEDQKLIFDNYWNSVIPVQTALDCVRAELTEAGFDLDTMRQKDLFNLADFLHYSR